MTEFFNVSNSNDDEDIIICGEFSRNNHKSNNNIIIKNKIASANHDNNLSNDDNILYINKNKKKCIYELKQPMKKQCKQIDTETNTVKHQFQKTNIRRLTNWGSQINNVKFYAAPVTFFKQIPFSHFWSGIYKNIIIEIPLLTNFLLTSTKSMDEIYEEIKNFNGEFYWIGWIQKIVGFNALMRYEGFDDARHDFWINLYNPHVHPLGWCAKNNRQLIFPSMVVNKQSDWKLHLKQLFVSSPTISWQFKENATYKSRFRIGQYLEVVDCCNLSQMKIAKIILIKGNRLTVEYSDTGAIFCCTEDSALIHPIGWSLKVGHRIQASHEYYRKCIKGILDQDDATEDLFIQTPKNFSCKFLQGMKLEAKDPLNLKQITVATVDRVLPDGYLMLRFENSNKVEYFCCHCTSPDIFPVGFCETYSIPIMPPNGENDFNWSTYLMKYNFIPAPKDYFYRTDTPKHDFQIGMKLECTDLTLPHLICMSTVTQIAGPLLCIHFDGWSKDYEQWLDYESPDLYPVGWCERFGHLLQGPTLNKTKNK